MPPQEESFEFEGLPVTCYRAGQGFPLLLIHGSGPGASSIGNWRTVLGPLSERYEVFAMDLVGFGRSGRKPQGPYFDYALWVRQAQAMLARIPGHTVGVIGHSLSASLALKLASLEPRVGAVLTTGAMGQTFTPNDATRRTWRCPTNRKELTLALSGLVYDQSVIDEAYLAAREPVVFSPGYAAYFDTMFEGDAQRYIDAACLDANTLSRITCPVSMLHGRDDVAFPPSVSMQLAAQLPQADLTVLARCSHSVAFEYPTKFLAAAHALFAPLAAPA